MDPFRDYPKPVHSGQRCFPFRRCEVCSSPSAQLLQEFFAMVRRSWSTAEIDILSATCAITRDRAPAYRPCMLLVTAFDLDHCVYQALKAGISGFLLKDEPPACFSRRHADDEQVIGVGEETHACRDQDRPVLRAGRRRVQAGQDRTADSSPRSG